MPDATLPPVPHAEDLSATELIDADHPRIRALAGRLAPPGLEARASARRLYLHVRDSVRYDPYTIDFSVQGMRASQTLAQGHGWCVPKATLLAALCRAAGLPARVGYADVRNHLSTRRLRELLDSDVYYWHSYTTIFLQGRWCKATPAFDAGLCAVSGLDPLEFDGHGDSLLQAYDRDGRRRLEYLRDIGEFREVPLERIKATFRDKYPRLVALAGADFQLEFAHERAGLDGSTGQPDA